MTVLAIWLFLGNPERSMELDLMILTGDFLLEIFCVSMILTLDSHATHSKAYLNNRERYRREVQSKCSGFLETAELRFSKGNLEKKAEKTNQPDKASYIQRAKGQCCEIMSLLGISVSTHCTKAL